MTKHLFATASAVALLAASTAFAAPQKDGVVAAQDNLVIAQAQQQDDTQASPGTERQPSTGGAGGAGGAAGGAAGSDTGASGAAGAESDTMSPDDEGAFRSYNANRAELEGQLSGQYAAEDLLGANIVSETGETVGQVEDLLITADNQVDKLIVDVGGFLGIGARTVALDVAEVNTGTEGDLTVSMTKEELEAMPEFEETGGEWRPATEEPGATGGGAMDREETTPGSGTTGGGAGGGAGGSGGSAQ